MPPTDIRLTKQQIIDYALSGDRISFDIEYDTTRFPHGRYAKHDEDFVIHGCSFAVMTENGVAGNYFTDLADVQEIIDATFDTVQIVAHFTAFDLSCLGLSGIKLPNFPRVYDTAVLCNLLYEDRRYGLKIITPHFLGYELDDFGSASEDGLDSPKFIKYACEDSVATLELFDLFKSDLMGQDLWKLAERLSKSTLWVRDMMDNGIAWDLDITEDLISKIYPLQDEVKSQIQAKGAGRTNLGSPKQLADLFFNELGWSKKGLDVTKKGAISTGEANLSKLAEKYELAELIMADRGLNKALSNYIEPLTFHSEFNADGRIHSRYQFLLKTGRSTARGDYPFQTTPTEFGKSIQFNKKLKAYIQDIKIRKGFVPPEGKALVVADMSSVEYRLAAVSFKDQLMIDNYRYYKCDSCEHEGSSETIVRKCPKCEGKVSQGVDLHQFNSDFCKSLGVDKSRQECKGLSFLSIFAGSWYKLAKDWNISKELAIQILEGVLNRFSGIKAGHKFSHDILYRSTQDRLGRQQPKGTVQCIFGRKRRVDLQRAERGSKARSREDDLSLEDSERKLRGVKKSLLNQLVNFPCQAGACTTIQICAQKLRKDIILAGLRDKIKIVAFVHDEIVLECDEDVAHQAEDMLVHALEETVHIGVPLPAESSIVYSKGFQGKCSRGYSAGSYADCK